MSTAEMLVAHLRGLAESAEMLSDSLHADPNMGAPTRHALAALHLARATAFREAEAQARAYLGVPPARPTTDLTK